MREAWDRMEALPSKAAIRADADRFTREYLIDMLQWNDRNGCYTDRLAEIEGFPPLTKEQAIELIVENISDSMWRYDDPRRSGESYRQSRSGPKEWRPRRPGPPK